MHKLIALIVGAVVAYIVNELLGEGRTNNIISIVIGIIIAFILWII